MDIFQLEMFDHIWKQHFLAIISKRKYLRKFEEFWSFTGEKSSLIILLSLTSISKDLEGTLIQRRN